MNLSRFFVAAGAALVAASLTGCAGGGSSATPSVPTLPTAPSSPATPSTPAPNACSAVAGFFEPPNTIVNGVQCTDQQASRSSVVWLQLLGSSGLAVLSCSGTVIDTRAVLTAGHCLADSIKGVAVYMGTRQVFVTTTEFYVHSAYTGIGPSLLDVAVVLFQEPLNLSVVPLLTSRAAVPGESAVIAGWGGDGRAGGGQTLRAGRLTVSRVAPLSILVDYSSTAASICYGDSGGPLLISESGVWAVAGVSSTTTSGCLSGTSSYGNVFSGSIKSFILKYVPGASER